MRIERKGAMRAVRSLSAVRFSNGNSQCVEFFEKLSQLPSGVSGERIAGKLDQRFVSLAVLSGRRGNQVMTNCNATQVFVGDWNRMAKRVQQNRIGGFIANSRQFKENVPQCGGGSLCHSIQRSLELRIEHCNERFDGRSLATVKSRWTYQGLESLNGKRTKA